MGSPSTSDSASSSKMQPSACIACSQTHKSRCVYQDPGGLQEMAIPHPILPPRRPHHSNLLSPTADLPKAPHIDPLAALPWVLDFSPGFSSNHRVRRGDECKLWSNTILNKTSEADHITIFTRDSKSNWNQEDSPQPAICAVVAFASGHETAKAA